MGILGNQNRSRTSFLVLCFSLFFGKRCQFLISQIISLAIKEELSTYTEDISIKWPNDIYWKEKRFVEY